MSSNRHPVDQLAAIRAAMAQLKRREKELRAYVLATDDLRGDDWRAFIEEQARERLDVRAARAGLGDNTLAPYLVSSTATFVKLRPRAHITLRPYDAPDPRLIPRRSAMVV